MHVKNEQLKWETGSEYILNKSPTTCIEYDKLCYAVVSYVKNT